MRFSHDFGLMHIIIVDPKSNKEFKLSILARERQFSALVIDMNNSWQVSYICEENKTETLWPSLSNRVPRLKGFLPELGMTRFLSHFFVIFPISDLKIIAKSHTSSKKSLLFGKSLISCANRPKFNASEV